MWLALLDWIIIAILTIKISKSEEANSETVVVRSVDQLESNNLENNQVTQNKIISKLGFNSSDIAEPFQNRADQERIQTEMCTGAISKENLTKPCKEKKLQAGIKLLDWKRRRKRFLEQRNRMKHLEIPGANERSREAFKNFNKTESSFSNNLQHINIVKKEIATLPELEHKTEITDKKIDHCSKLCFEELGKTKEKGLSIDDNSEVVHINTQLLDYNKNNPHLETFIHFFDEFPELKNASDAFSRNLRRTKRKAKNKKTVDYDNDDDDYGDKEEPNEPIQKEQKNIINKNKQKLNVEVNPIATSTFHEKFESTTNQGNSSVINTNLNLKTGSSTSNLISTTKKKLSTQTIVESSSAIKKNCINKVKEIINGDSNSTQVLNNQDNFCIKHSNSKVTKCGFPACVTPPVSTTTGCGASTCEGAPDAECHPKGSGPLNPCSNEAETSSGPKSEEEVEDALTGKLADRVVEVVMAKVSKEPRMMKELGLYCQGNLTKVQSSVSHPESKSMCQEKSGDNLKQSVLKEITAAVNKLAKGSSGSCLKPPGDLIEFLGWLLTEDPEADMPEPPCENNIQKRQDGEYLFRTNLYSDEEYVEPKEISKCNWNNWIIYSDDNEEGYDKFNFDSFDNTPHTVNNKQRIARNTMKRRKKHQKDNHKKNDEQRRKKYTPWSLNDYL